ncbi:MULTISPECIES: YCF48-related protein [Pseudomonas]|uniref:Glycosyl hydrolase n=1 Tax=Pseudomonas juntendi TaxID=2666183 RepID=A0A7W2QZD8_9PSED|nr:MULTISPECIES: YCF48-related protein [Pseudomonas]MBA6133295.1 glycosyl hydrolase [Pseudomonas juntendi]MBA6148571.1 glycosyl hydrolase [Pseudomonas juntendi]MCK2110361.1 YCF48-related protein [Pseudomonas juntendi]MCK2114678.1 YCF48-related protein [Pseudomonas juntendi]MDG9810078.1 YCF48-related protein [Pseudomonas juntendi]
MKFRVSFTAALLAAAVPLMSLQAAPLQAVPAVQASNATQATMLAAGWAGARMVAVGDHGVVLLSDDQGMQWRQARSVPLSTPLTGVSFVDAKRGWAVGHWGAILATTDGGESWRAQRLATEEDRPLFAVHFFNARQGVAVGLWSLVLTTEDGGQTWAEQPLQAPPGAKRADLNLMGLFADSRGRLYATAEHGQVLHSEDQGKNWRYLDTGYEGTLWSGAVLADGRLLLGGQRGTLLQGSADGKGFRRVPTQSKGSVTSVAVAGSRVLAVGLDGLSVQSSDDGHSFQETQTADGLSLTAALFNAEGVPVLFSRRGVMPCQE